MISALRITRTFISGNPVYLLHFAMWTAFPPSDYYWSSVPMRLSPFRESRVFDVVDVQADLGAPFVSSRSLETTLFPGVLRDGRNRLSRWPTGWSGRRSWEPRILAAVSEPWFLQNGHWGSNSIAFTLSAGSWPSYDQAVSSYSAFPNMLLSPPPFGFRWVR
jgi:hypothetical protein